MPPLVRSKRMSFRDDRFAARPRRNAAPARKARKPARSVSAMSSLVEKSVYTGTGSGKLAGFPQNKRVTLRYSAEISVASPGPGLAAGHVFRLNSIFDPDLTGTGHNPLGYDQWLAIYNNYHVVDARIKATRTYTTTGAVAPSMMCIAVVDRTAALETDTQTISERQDYSAMVQTGDADQGIQVSRQTVNMSKFFGVKDVADDADLGAVVTQNPLKSCLAAVTFCSINNNQFGTALALVEIEFDIVFTDPKGLQGS